MYELVFLFIMVGFLLCFILYKIIHKTRDQTEYLSDIVPIETNHLTDLSEYLLKSRAHKKRLHNYNPTLFTYKDKMYIVYRVSSFTYCNYHEHLINAVQRAVNYIYIECPNKNIVHVDYPKSQLFTFCSESYEDPRAIVLNHQLLLICTNSQVYKCKNKMVILVIDLDNTDLDYAQTIRPNKIIPLIYDNTNIHTVEKNWVPFISNQKLHFLYHINPQVVLECDLNTGICKKIAETHYHNLPTNIRGGTQAILLRDQYYLAVGHVLQKIILKKIYYTFFYTFEKDFPFHIISISKLFFIDRADTGVWDPIIQYASGLEIIKDQVYLTYGYNDCFSRMLTFHVKHIDKILK